MIRKEMTEEEKKAMPRLMGGAVIGSFLLSYGLQVIIHSVNATEFISGATIGFVLWLGFAVTHSLNTQFEGRKPIVLVINNVLYLITVSKAILLIFIPYRVLFGPFRHPIWYEIK